MVERRNSLRMNIDFSIECRGRKIWQNAQACNISCGGVFIVTEKIEVPDTELEIIFELGGERKRRIFAEGVVVWTRSKLRTGDDPAGMGVRFTKIFPADGEKFLKSIIGEGEKHDDQQT